MVGQSERHELVDLSELLLQVDQLEDLSAIEPKFVRLVAQQLELLAHLVLVAL